jgi:hypothetical protein
VPVPCTFVVLVLTFTRRGRRREVDLVVELVQDLVEQRRRCKRTDQEELDERNREGKGREGPRVERG